MPSHEQARSRNQFNFSNTVAMVQFSMLGFTNCYSITMGLEVESAETILGYIKQMEDSVS